MTAVESALEVDRHLEAVTEDEVTSTASATSKSQAMPRKPSGSTNPVARPFTARVEGRLRPASRCPVPCLGAATIFRSNRPWVAILIHVTASARVIHLVPAPGLSDAPSRVRPPRIPVTFEERIARALQRYLPFVWRVLRRMGLSRTEATRALSHVFGALAEQPRVPRPTELSILVGAAVRLASNRRRPRSLRQPESEAEPCDAETLPWQDALELRDSLLLIDGALGALHAAQRAVFVLVELEGMTRGQVAAALELPRRTVSARLERARQEFGLAARRLLDESGSRTPSVGPARATRGRPGIRSLAPSGRANAAPRRPA